MSKARNLADLGDDFDGTDMVVSGELESQSLKINGTTVIDSSRNLSNVGGLKTVNGTSIVGSGDISAGASTDYGAVGTYGFFVTKSTSTFEAGTTASGSSLYRLTRTDGVQFTNARYNTSAVASAGHSGTWRRMARQSGNNFSDNSNDNAGITLWVRVS